MALVLDVGEAPEKVLEQAIIFTDDPFIERGYAFSRPLAEPGILVSGQEKINEEPQCTKVHEDSHTT